jgi:hypothetical protein
MYWPSHDRELISVAVMVAEVIFMLMGFLLGQIRTLQRLSFLANLAIWLNVIVIIMTWVLPPHLRVLGSRR